jgi:D-apionolactonase
MSGTSLEFTAGDLAFRLDANTGGVRAIRFRGHEVLRGIYPAVRGTAWETLTPNVAPPAVESSEQHVSVRLSARVASPVISLSWQAHIDVDTRGTFRFHWRGCAQHDSLTNRAGMCVLHPSESAGAPCAIQHSDGATTTGRFPVAISPQQPFRNIRSITHSFADGGEALVRFEGEVFEMEDQRNWTDASFKTYCRPLDWPAPYQLPAGTVIEHTITVTIRGEPAPLAFARGESRLSSTPVALSWPRIGFGLRNPLPSSLRERSWRLHPAHLRVETTGALLSATLDWAAPEARALDCELELAVIDATVRPPSRASLPSRCSVALFDAAGNGASSDVIAAWKRAGFESISAGTRNHFAELNRARPPVDDAHDRTTFGIDAQVHAFDEASVLETLTQHGIVAQHAASFGAPRPVAVAPIVLGPGRDSADPRLFSEFGALWTFGSLVRLAGTGIVERVTYFQLHGPDGILREDVPSTSLEHLFLTFATATRVERLPLESGGEHLVDVLLVHAGTRRELLIANFDETAMQLIVPFGVGLVQLAPRAVRHLPLLA